MADRKKEPNVSPNNTHKRQSSFIYLALLITYRTGIERSVTIAQWENEYIALSVLSVARVQCSAMAEYPKGLLLYRVW